jgi:hypothetical protein
MHSGIPEKQWPSTAALRRNGIHPAEVAVLVAVVARPADRHLQTAASAVVQPVAGRAHRPMPPGTGQQPRDTGINARGSPRRGAVHRGPGDGPLNRYPGLRVFHQKPEAKHNGRAISGTPARLDQVQPGNPHRLPPMAADRGSSSRLRILKADRSAKSHQPIKPRVAEITRVQVAINTIVLHGRDDLAVGVGAPGN